MRLTTAAPQDDELKNSDVPFWPIVHKKRSEKTAKDFAQDAVQLLVGKPVIVIHCHDHDHDHAPHTHTHTHTRARR